MVDTSIVHGVYHLLTGSNILYELYQSQVPIYWDPSKLSESQKTPHRSEFVGF